MNNEEFEEARQFVIKKTKKIYSYAFQQKT